MGCFGRSPFPQRTQKSNGFVGLGSTKASVRFPNALGRSQNWGPERRGVERGWSTELSGGEGSVEGVGGEAAAVGQGLDLTGLG